MCVYFVKCSVETVKYRNYDYSNNPINLALCRFITKKQYKCYPDNIGIPAIYFDDDNLHWLYQDVKQRDKDFDMLTNIKIGG